MTGMPEAVLARELAMCFTTVALVTDHDAGVDGQEAVSHEEVLAVFAANIEGLKGLLRSAVGRLPDAEPDDTGGVPLPTCARRPAPALRAPGRPTGGVGFMSSRGVA